ncbi:unnamed protein product [Vicia faba]|uniref:Uncharacterized protein n=1 Tax=Vicia faba TaxID=3906 RepID=A0AAV0YDZ2_VICFA|nr:unnamed protein product [Vicia faba]
MIRFHKILSYLLLINVGLLILLGNNGESSATHFPSTTLESNGDVMLLENVDQFRKQGSKVLADNNYYKTKEILGGYYRSRHHSFPPGKFVRILHDVPSGPSPIHNPETPPPPNYV